MSSPEESRPLHSPSLPQSPTTPRRPSPLSPFSTTNSRASIIRKVSEESRTLGRSASSPLNQVPPSQGQSSETSTRTSSSSGSPPPSNTINANPGTHLLRPRPPSDGNPRSPSMILYQLAVPGLAFPRETQYTDDDLLPPKFPSVSSRPGSFHSRDSVFSMSSDSKYPTYDNVEHGYVAYAYDPMLDDEEEELVVGKQTTMSWRGLMNMGMLLLIITGLLALFVGGPVVDFLRRDDDLYVSNQDDEVLPKAAAIKSTTAAEVAAPEPTEDTVVPVAGVERRYPIFIPEIRH